jgi:hypothetical protein
MQMVESQDVLRATLTSEKLAPPGLARALAKTPGKTKK